MEKRLEVKSFFHKFIFCTLAAGVFGFNLSSFIRAGNLIPGGFSGITVLVQQICRQFFDFELPFSAVYLPLSAIPVVIGFKFIGKKFTLWSLYVLVLSSVLTDVLPRITITYDVLLIAIFGGILAGIAGLLSLGAGASGGGTDFISIYFSEKKGIDAWNYILAGNVAIILCAGILFGFDKALYSIIYQFTTTQVLNAMYKRYQKDTLLIITDMPNAIYGKIKELTNHDATLIKGTGCYEGGEKNVLYSVVGRAEVEKVISEIKKLDEHAFINVINTSQINGNFFRRPTE